MEFSFIKSKYISKQALSTSALAETSQTSGRFSSWVTIGFLPFINYSLWKQLASLAKWLRIFYELSSCGFKYHFSFWMYTPSFSFPWILDSSIRIPKNFDLKQLSQGSWHLPLHVHLLITYKDLYWHIKILHLPQTSNFLLT